MRIVDLSFPIRPHFRWKVAPQLVASHAEGHPLQSTLLTIGCHAYTHVDQWVGEAAVVDLTHLGANGEVTAEDLKRRGDHVRSGDIVLLRTDWPSPSRGGARRATSTRRTRSSFRPGSR